MLIAIGVTFGSIGSAGAASSTRLIWGVRMDGSVSRYLGSGQWDTWSGSLAQVDVGTGRVWGVTRGRATCNRYQGSGHWDVLGEGFQDVSVGLANSGRVVWGAKTDGSVARYVGGGKWRRCRARSCRSMWAPGGYGV